MNVCITVAIHKVHKHTCVPRKGKISVYLHIDRQDQLKGTNTLLK